MNAVNIINALLVFFSIFMIYKSVKDSDTLVAKSISIMIWLCVILVLILYYLDLYNIPSRLMWNRNLNVDTWLAGIFTLLSAFLGGGLLLIVTKWQIDVSEKNSRIRDKEENRIKFLPLLKYSINRINSGNEETIYSIDPGQYHMSLSLHIQNIGNSPVRSLFLKIKSEKLFNEQKYKFSSMGSLEQNGELKVTFQSAIKKGSYCIDVDVIFEDLLLNKYVQSIKIYITTSEDNFHDTKIEKYEVDNEKLINE